MKQFFVDILKRYQHLYRAAYRGYLLLCQSVRIVRLSQNVLTQKAFDRIKNNSKYNDIITDLVAYTGFSEEKLTPYLLRHPIKHFESEFNWFQPKDNAELAWFYRCSSAYLFANSVHGGLIAETEPAASSGHLVLPGLPAGRRPLLSELPRGV